MQLYRRIVIPLLRPAFLSAFVVLAHLAIKSYDLVVALTGGGPGRATEILVTYIYKLGFVQTKFDYAAAVTVFFFLLLVVIAWGANRLSGGNAGAVERD